MALNALKKQKNLEMEKQFFDVFKSLLAVTIKGGKREEVLPKKCYRRTIVCF